MVQLFHFDKLFHFETKYTTNLKKENLNENPMKIYIRFRQKKEKKIPQKRMWQSGIGIKIEKENWL